MTPKKRKKRKKNDRRTFEITRQSLHASKEWKIDEKIEKTKIMQSCEFHINLLISADDDGEDNNMFIVG